MFEEFLGFEWDFPCEREREREKAIVGPSAHGGHMLSFVA